MAAISGQVAMTAESWPSELGSLLVRIGLHTGESQERDGDYYGPELNRASRIMSAAHGGQVLLSNVTAALVQDSLTSGISLRVLGEHYLRDLARPETLFQLCHPALDCDFPQSNPFPLLNTTCRCSSQVL